VIDPVEKFFEIKIDRDAPSAMYRGA